jgi:hypothetical protein
LVTPQLGLVTRQLLGKNHLRTKTTHSTPSRNVVQTCFGR